VARSSTSFKPGNTAALKHGLYAGRWARDNRRLEVVGEVVASLLRERPELVQAGYLTELLVDALADVAQLRQALDALAPVSRDRRVRGGLLEALGRPERDALDLAARLGLTSTEAQALREVAEDQPPRKPVRRS
jgi:hypothetical protein